MKLKGDYIMKSQELVQEYQDRLRNSKQKKDELKVIILEINQLVYSGTQNSISSEDKLNILEKLRIEIVNESVVQFAQDNAEFLKLLDSTIKSLGGK